MSDSFHRSIADQINLSGVEVVIPPEYLSTGSAPLGKDSTVSFQLLRVLAANYIRRNPDDFTPFLEMSADDPEFAAYCDKVESEVQCEWGGQLEITALCACLGLQIHVYSADSPVLVMGGDADGNSSSGVESSRKPLRISFHRHYFALGEHYNSVISSSVGTVFQGLKI